MEFFGGGGVFYWFGACCHILTNLVKRNASRLPLPLYTLTKVFSPAFIMSSCEVSATDWLDTAVAAVKCCSERNFLKATAFLMPYNLDVVLHLRSACTNRILLHTSSPNLALVFLIFYVLLFLSASLFFFFGLSLKNVMWCLHVCMIAKQYQ